MTNKLETEDAIRCIRYAVKGLGSLSDLRNEILILCDRVEYLEHENKKLKNRLALCETNEIIKILQDDIRELKNNIFDLERENKKLEKRILE